MREKVVCLDQHTDHKLRTFKYQQAEAGGTWFDTITQSCVVRMSRSMFYFSLFWLV